MEPFKYASIITTISVFAALFSIIFQAKMKSNDLQHLTTVLRSLMILENNVSQRLTKPRITVVGYDTCEKLHIRGTVFLNYTEEIEDFSDVEEINSERDLLIKFYHYFQKEDDSPELYIPNKDLFQKLISKAKQLEFRWKLDCSANKVAMKLIQEDVDVLLAARIPNTFASKHLHQDIKMTNIDFFSEDNIHLILEYQTGEKWGKRIAPRTNHLAIHSDNHNPPLNLLHTYTAKLLQFNPRLLIVSGLQILNHLTKESRELILNQIQTQFQNLPGSTLVHLEMTHFEVNVLNQIFQLFPYIDSLGLNEQELENLRDKLEKGTISKAPVEKNIQVSKSLDHLRSVFTHLHNLHHTNNSKGQKVNRIHLHTLAYQIIMIGRPSEWRNTKASAAKASIGASKYVCGMNILNPESFQLVLNQFSNSQKSPIKNIPIQDDDPVSCWTEISIDSIEVEFCVVPNLICKNALETSNTGDIISVNGLILAI